MNRDTLTHFWLFLTNWLSETSSKGEDAFCNWKRKKEEDGGSRGFWWKSIPNHPSPFLRPGVGGCVAGVACFVTSCGWWVSKYHNPPTLKYHNTLSLSLSLVLHSTLHFIIALDSIVKFIKIWFGIGSSSSRVKRNKSIHPASQLLMVSTHPASVSWTMKVYKMLQILILGLFFYATAPSPLLTMSTHFQSIALLLLHRINTESSIWSTFAFNNTANNYKN